jgi:PAS domain S-box-containing protein
MKILIAEDARTSRLVLQSVLRNWGHEVIAVEDGLAAWQTLQTPDAPRLAILDWEMPGLLGIEVCRKARSQPLTPPPYLLVLTAKDGKEHIATALQAGANDYLTKPFNPAELRIRLDVGISMLDLQSLEAASRELEKRVQERTAELATAHANNERLLASISSVLIVLDEDDRITKWNKTAEKVFAFAESQVLGQPFSSVKIAWEDRYFVEQLLDCGRETEQTRAEKVAFVRPDGHQGYVNLCITPILDQRAGVPSGVLMLGEDRTKQCFLEAQLSQAQKLESIGQLAAGIAHEINTPIQYIGDNTHFLSDSFTGLQEALRAYERLAEAAQAGPVSPELLDELAAQVQAADLEYLGEEIPRALDQTQEGVAHVARIVQAMKEFSHPGGREKTLIDLHRAMENTITIARNEWKEVARVEMDLDPEMPPVPCLPGELNQVLLNLLVNATHAIAEKRTATLGDLGLITVRTRRTLGQAEIQIEDSGSGIPEAIRGKIFDPFFTTKPLGKGTGQGLSIAHAVIVQKHGGTLTFQTEVGKGTTFFIRLPLDLHRNGQSRCLQEAERAVGV